MSDTQKRDGSSAVTIDVNLPRKADGVLATRKYWVGTLPTCPFQNVEAGGISFPRFRGDHLDAAGNEIPESRRAHGLFIDLTDEQVDLVKAAVRLRVIRIVGDALDDFEDVDDDETYKVKKSKGRGTAQMLMLDGPHVGGALGRHDRPLAQFIYMHDVSQMSATELQSAWPPASMAAPPEEEETPEPVGSGMGSGDGGGGG